MTAFGVWAPSARRVVVEVDGRQAPMEPTGGGWQGAEVSWAAANGDYWFVVDGDRLPDPRSQWQPHGVPGPSRLVDHGAFAWTDGAWRGLSLPSAVLYELHVGTFTPEGTFDAVIAKLDHLVGLGIDAVELMPVCEFPGSRGWGYDGVALYAPHHAYGGPDGLKRLVDACHSRGLGVVMDVVYNHLGPGGDYMQRYGPYLDPGRSTPWGPAVNLDGAGSDEVRAFFVDNAVMWFEDYHCDGIRVDAVHSMFDTSPVHLVEQLSVRAEEVSAHLGRHTVVIAESDLNDPRVVRRREVGGYGADAQWSDDFHHALHAVLTDEGAGCYADFGTMGHLAAAIERAFVYAGEYSTRRRRSHGRHDPTLSGSRFLAYLQNHDQVGNRAGGERSAALMSTARLKVGAALVLTSPFLPLLFQGEEWGAATPFLYFADHRDPEVVSAVREGRLRDLASLGWLPGDVADPQDPTTFERSKLDWSELADGNRVSRHRELLDWYRRLIRLRRQLPALSDGRLDRVRTSYDERNRWLVVERGPVTTACNLGSGRARLAARGRLVLGSVPALASDGDHIELPPDAVAVLRADP
ncbi:MAG: malto-oligosyltrehalose trehalohydrolase [Actinomycetota bacterium]|nr:malto-oligosyltrehalose trehalohydrolase [Actinomycetota bacterium]MDQ3574051.1 malto-oligosyltrehalose trehalohydrolase [Actinomycetota bacterium]